MNIYFVIILAVLILEYALGIISSRLNAKSMSTSVPVEFEDIYDKESYAKSQKYNQERTNFSNISSTFSLAVLLVFWFAGGFPYVNEIASQFASSMIIKGLIFFGILILGLQLLSLPFSIYSTFVIEEKYGFNKTTPKTFVFDLLKGLLLTIVLGGSILALVLFIFQELGEISWLVAWGATIVITLVVQYIAPKWIMPMFNKFEKLEEGELRDKIMTFADKVNFKLDDIYVMDGSKRSSKSNAFFTGFGKNKRIA